MAHSSTLCDIPKPRRQIIYPIQTELVDLGIRVPLSWASVTDCASCLPTLSPFESFCISVPFHRRWKNVIDDPDHQWLGLLCLFNTVQELYLSEYVTACVAQALKPSEKCILQGQMLSNEIK